MAAGIPARLTRQEGRRFGLTVGTALLVVAAIAGARAHATTATVMALLGGLLALAGLLIPTRLGPVQRGWMTFAHAMSRVTTPIVMGIMYYVILTPTAWLRRGLGRNPLVHEPGPAGFWQERPPNARGSASMERQF